MAHLSDDEVLANLGSVIGSRRRITAQLVAYLGEVEARRLELREACSSMYEFCCRKLKLSEGSAHRHLAAARIARSYPMVLDLLREGRIHVTALSMLQTYLSVENHAELLAAACDKSKAEVELLIRSRFPRPDVADAICPVFVQAQLGGNTAVAGQSGGAAAGQSNVADSGPAAVALAAAGQSAAGASRVATVELHEPRPRVSPLSAQRFHIQFSAGTSFKDKLERALDLMSHSNPKRDLATVIERGLDLVLAELEKKKLGKTDRPRRSTGTKHGDFSRQARREIYERDGEQCTYTSPNGERCQARAFVQLDHEDPRACGGAGTTRNGRLLCRAHNLFEAEKVFGRKYVESRIRLRQQRLDRQSRSALEQTNAELPAAPDALTCRQSDANTPPTPDASNCQQSDANTPPTPDASNCQQSDANTPPTPDASNCHTSSADEPASTGALSRRTSSADEPASTGALSRRTSSADEIISTDTPNCRTSSADEPASTGALSRRTSSADEPASTGALSRRTSSADEIISTDTPNCHTSSADEIISTDMPNCHTSSDEIISTGALSRRTSSADEIISTDTPNCRTSSADEVVPTDASSCRVDDACELRANQSFRSLEHAAGGAADLDAETSRGREVRDQARVNSADVESKLVSALTNMGFRRGESKKAVAALACRGDTRGPRAEHLATLLRQALAILVP